MSKPPAENTPAAVLLKTYLEVQELLRLYSVASSIQHERPQKGGGGPRQKGTHSDPTGSMGTEAASNKGVRAAVRNVDAKALHLHDTISALNRQLESAIDRWDS